MLPFDQNSHLKWSKHIVFAGNGFGKTTNANQLKDFLASRGRNVSIFTRRAIEKLMAGKEGRLFFGKAAEEAVRVERNMEMIKKNSPIKDMMRSITSKGSVKDAKSVSFLARCAEISAMDAMIKKPSCKKRDDTFDFLDQEDELATLDRILNYDLYKKCQFFADAKQSELENKPLASNEVPDDYEECIIRLIIMMRVSSKKECVLCGKRYRSSKALLDAADKHFQSLSFVSDESKSSQIMRLTEAIYRDVPNMGIASRAFDAEPPKTVYKALRMVRTYQRICDSYLWKRYDELANLQANNGRTVGSIQDEIDRDNAIIEKEKTSKGSIRRYNAFLRKEVAKILDMEGIYSVSGMQDQMGITLTKNGKPISTSPYQILSESQIKRLCLIALAAEIKYGAVDALILDDPVDSYDDYNKLLACKYISGVLKSSSIADWYIFTNDYEGLFYLTSYLHAPVLFYLQDFPASFGGRRELIEVNCTAREIMNRVNRNDIHYLVEYITKGLDPNLDGALLTCGLLMTLRNLDKEIVERSNDLNVTSSTRGKIALDANWGDDIENKVVASAEHYRHSDSIHPIGSDNLSVGAICACYSALHKGTSLSYPSMHKHSTDLFCAYREQTAKKTISYTGGWPDIINYLFKKMTAISFIKFEMERRLIVTCSVSFSPTEIEKIIKAGGLGAKIERAKETNRSRHYGLEDALSKFDKIHKDYSVMYNAFDHALVYQITPYLTTSTKDIERFWNRVRTL